MKKVLQLTVHLFPNVGGVETHLNNLFAALTKRGWKVFCLAYQPLSTKVSWKIFEQGEDIKILRIFWLRGFFEKLVNRPLLEFIYLVPGLFMVAPFVILGERPNVIHAHGLSAATAAVFWGKVFGIRTVVSLHSFYSFPKKGLYHDFVKLLFKHTDHILSLSKKSNEEVKELGITKEKTGVFTYWIDLEKFQITNNKFQIRKKMGWSKKFIVLFVGRLIKEKGLGVLLQAAKTWNKSIQLVIIGAGPMEEEIRRKATKIRQLQFIGKKSQVELPLYYSAADCLIVPSTSEEGFGRVIIESLACGTPVIASKKGAISEAMDETVGKFIEVTPENIKKVVEYFYKNTHGLLKLSKNARKFVERRYSEENVNAIIKAYSE